MKTPRELLPPTVYQIFGDEMIIELEGALKRSKGAMVTLQVRYALVTEGGLENETAIYVVNKAREAGWVAWCNMKTDDCPAEVVCMSPG